MGFNDFHKGFVNRGQVQKPNVVMKQKFGVRTVEEIIESRYRGREDKPVEKPVVQRKMNDYQQNMRGQRNLRNLDK